MGSSCEFQCSAGCGCCRHGDSSMYVVSQHGKTPLVLVGSWRVALSEPSGGPRNLFTPSCSPPLLMLSVLMVPPADKSFDDDDSVDGSQSTSGQSVFKVPATRKPGNAARRPSASSAAKSAGGAASHTHA